MKDSELLGLLDRAQERQRGEKGEPGTGIDRIEQFDDESFTIKLTTGESRKISLPIAKDGEVGATGSVGPRGPEGAAGKPGRDGASATDGQPGPQGLPGVSLSTAVVNDSGELLLQLSDGVIINVGRVRGPAGATGGQGATGLPGDPGRDGKQMLSGPRTPTQDDGEEGDHWIDVSDTSFALFKKDGGGWTKIADLRQIVQPRAVSAPGGGGGAGGGKGELQNTRTLPLVNPTTLRSAIPASFPDPASLATQEDANKYLLKAIEAGMVYVGEFQPYPATENTGGLWWCTYENDLTLYISTGTEWVPASPPVSLDGIETSIAALQEVIDTNILPALVGVSSDVRTIEAAGYKLQDEIAADQERQDGQIASLAEEIELLAPSIDRGSWDWVSCKADSEGVYDLKPGEFTTIKPADKDAIDACNAEEQNCLVMSGDDPIASSKCARDAEACRQAADAGPSNDYSKVTLAVFHPIDNKGAKHTFKDVTEGESYIDIFDDQDEDFLVGKVTYNVTNIVDGPTKIYFDLVQSKGTAGGQAHVKFFEIAEGDVSNYVRKTGDTMEGQLRIEKTRTDSNANSFIIRGRVNGKETNLFKDYQRKSGAEKDDYIEYFGANASDNCILNKSQILKLIEDNLPDTNIVYGVPYKYVDKSKDKLNAGEFTLEKNKDICASFQDLNGRTVGPRSRDFWDQGITGFMKAYDNTGALIRFYKFNYIEHGQPDTRHMRWSREDDIETGTFKDGHVYYLADGMMLPY